LLEQARAGYNYVLLQLGSVTADTRNLVSATHADAMLLLAHENKTLMRELLAAEQLLRGNGVDDVRVIVAAGES
jgi:Mrp family chromosome partitioning ATPase